MKKLKEKWKIILISILILPCVVFFASCGAGDDGSSSGTNSNVTHTVMFYTNSPEEFNYPTQEVQNGKLVRRPSNPTKYGYVFIGWYKDMALTEVWKFESDVVTSDMVLYAKWEERQY